MLKIKATIIAFLFSTHIFNLLHAETLNIFIPILIINEQVMTSRSVC